MASINKTIATLETTHEGARAKRISPSFQLRRSVLASFLWEDNFYEDGVSHSQRVIELTKQVPTEEVISLAVEARSKGNLRHMPLFLLNALIKSQKATSEERTAIGRAIPEVIQRPDEMGELISLYWQDGKKPLTNQMKIGIGNAFKKFNEYSLGKYDNRNKAVKIRDVMFLTHPKPDNKAQELLFKKVANQQLETPDTWETQLSAGADKKSTFERLMAENKLGAMAFIRNLRNMEQAGVAKSVVSAYADKVNTDRVLPFRFISAARACPNWSDVLERMMLRSCAEMPKLKGKTAIIVDNSGSMYGTKVSAKSDIDRADAAQALAVLIREIAEDSVVISYSMSAVVIPSHYRGLSLMQMVNRATGHGGTDTRSAILEAQKQGFDRIIVITDEQTSTKVPSPGVKAHKAYFINVATYKNGVGYNEWTHIDGFSESTVKYIMENEALHENVD